MLTHPSHSVMPFTDVAGCGLPTRPGVTGAELLPGPGIHRWRERMSGLWWPDPALADSHDVRQNRAFHGDETKRILMRATRIAAEVIRIVTVQEHLLWLAQMATKKAKQRPAPVAPGKHKSPPVVPDTGAGEPRPRRAAGHQ